MRPISTQAQLPTFASCQNVANLIYGLDSDAMVNIREGRGKIGPWLIGARFFLANDANYDDAMHKVREIIEALGGTGKVRAR